MKNFFARTASMQVCIIGMRSEKQSVKTNAKMLYYSYILTGRNAFIIIKHMQRRKDL